MTRNYTRVSNKRAAHLFAHEEFFLPTCPLLTLNKRNLVDRNPYLLTTYTFIRDLRVLTSPNSWVCLRTQLLWILK